jgi:uncharacterized protein YprB with RNaseH-like and TPR domain
MSGPRVLFLDIETAPIEAYVWGTWDQNVSNNMIKKDWTILSWAAKWQGKKKVMYQDVQKQTEKKMLQGMWDLLNQADIIVTQNGKSFDSKKLNARFIMLGFKPPSTYEHIDTLRLAKKHFGFTSNKLEYMTEKLNTKYKKLQHKKFPGFELWSECLKGNKAAWKEMSVYNQHDVLALEELYDKLIAWEPNQNHGKYSDEDFLCTCGSRQRTKNGFVFAGQVKYQRYVCMNCGARSRVAVKREPKN